MGTTTKYYISALIVNVVGGIMIPQLLLPSFFSGVRNESPEWGSLAFYMYLGIFVSIGGSGIMTLLFKEKTNTKDLVYAIIETTFAAIVNLVFICYIIVSLTLPFIGDLSLTDKFTIYFQYPAYAGIYSTQPIVIFMLAVVIYNIIYMVRIRAYR